MTVRIFSSGCGVQSTAALILAAQGKIDYKDFIFSNVGHDSENPATLDYVHQYSIPYAAAHGLNFYEIHKERKDGTNVTLYQQLTKEKSRSIGIPVRMANSGAPGRRSCTVEYKIKPINRWLRANRGIDTILQKERRDEKAVKALRAHMLQHGHEASQVEQICSQILEMTKAPRPLAIVGLGISTDEWHRARKESGVEWKVLDYPLLDLGISRQQCKEIIAAEGLPVPEESSCWFCPMHTTARWRTMRSETPQLFEKAGALEQLLNQRRAMLGLDNVYFHHKLLPLAQAIPTLPLSNQEHEAELQAQCVEGGCFL